MNFRVLVVDDEEVNLDILRRQLQRAGYEVDSAVCGEEAWEMLCRYPMHYGAVLLDRMMPGIDGLEVLKLMKGHPVLQFVPVIMQTAAAATEQVVEGIQAGAYYYLTKPFKREIMLSVLEGALRDYRSYRELLDLQQEAGTVMRRLHLAEFSFSTIQEGASITDFLAKLCPEPERVAIGLLELIINAVEHGNLGITYDEKGRLLRENALDDEIEMRLKDPKYRDRYASLRYKRSTIEDSQVVSIIIEDMGEGFDYPKFLGLDYMDRLFDNHGRGILMAQASFDTLEYRGCGNTVVVTLCID